MKPIPAYAFPVVAAATTRRDNRLSGRRASANRQALFFCLLSLKGGLRGAPSSVAGVLLGRFVTPASIRHPRCDKRSGGLQILVGDLP